MALKLSQNIVVFQKPFDWAHVSNTFTQKVDVKPEGIWYACGREWINYLESESPEDTISHVYELTLDKSYFLILNTNEKILNFNKQYGLTKYLGVGKDSDSFKFVDWPFVKMQGYKGIEICPYARKLRNDNRVEWYYPWDVASGCFWDSSVK